LWTIKYPAQEISVDVFRGAAELVSKHAFQVWDAVILSAADAGAATVLFSEGHA
jgi:predicted nucleic acid-binding protein